MDYLLYALGPIGFAAGYVASALTQQHDQEQEYAEDAVGDPVRWGLRDEPHAHKFTTMRGDGKWRCGLCGKARRP